MPPTIWPSISIVAAAAAGGSDRAVHIGTVLAAEEGQDSPRLYGCLDGRLGQQRPLRLRRVAPDVLALNHDRCKSRQAAASLECEKRLGLSLGGEDHAVSTVESLPDDGVAGVHGHAQRLLTVLHPRRRASHNLAVDFDRRGAGLNAPYGKQNQAPLDDR